MSCLHGTCSPLHSLARARHLPSTSYPQESGEFYWNYWVKRRKLKGRKKNNAQFNLSHSISKVPLCCSLEKIFLLRRVPFPSWLRLPPSCLKILLCSWPFAVPLLQSHSLVSLHILFSLLNSWYFIIFDIKQFYFQCCSSNLSIWDLWPHIPNQKIVKVFSNT